MLEALVIVGLASTLSFLLWWLHRPRGMPPGPPRSFWGDNTLDIPRVKPWETFTAWNRKYGPVVSFYLGRKPVIVLGTAQAAWDLLDKRADIYSARPRSIVALSHTGVWRMAQLMQASLSATASAQYRSLQSLESKLMLRRLLNLKDDFAYKSEITLFQMSVIFRLAYGRRVKSLQDEVVLAKIKAGSYFGEPAYKADDMSCVVNRVHRRVPGKYLVESWPILLWLPKCLQWFRRDIDKHREMDVALYMSLMHQVRRKMADGTAQPSMATIALGKQEEFGLTELETAYTLSGPWDAGVVTTLVTIDNFLLAMLHHQDAYLKLRDELDEVVGPNRLPEYSDMESLPYLMAALKEVTRWRAAAPTGFPHAVTQDDVYQGHFIPKGATVYGNIHAITQDPEMFPEPDVFRPERFLDATNAKLANFTIPFGFGRRICPGMHVANQSIYIAVARILWAFDIAPAQDEHGNSILPSTTAYTTRLVTGPEPFPVVLKVRGKSVEELIVLESERAEAEAMRWDVE
ncbi:cytochrome P450 [Ganoderma sinense ZZ0214-1]|uniref:Cytochrome P450 n=1 Tax=Ganoderma sinense ZZ0214-1 TaxID=1077348 RepID=A0A2G8RSX7_9APHY|nr:cytochrome P450 [Ganoderma sinense ZZ0214-1]